MRPKILLEIEKDISQQKAPCIRKTEQLSMYTPNISKICEENDMKRNRQVIFAMFIGPSESLTEQLDRNHQALKRLDAISRLVLTFIELQQPHTHAFQEHVEHTPRKTICSAIKQISLN